MPKPLTKPQPSSSVATSLVDTTAMQEALMGSSEAASNNKLRVVRDDEATGSNPPPQVTPTERTGEPAKTHRQVILTESTDKTLKHLRQLFSGVTGSEVKNSNVARAWLMVSEHAKTQIEQAAAAIGPQDMPSNKFGNEHKRDAFDRKLAAAIFEGFRNAAAFECE